mgnify:CR=1 FL=1
MYGILVVVLVVIIGVFMYNRLIRSRNILNEAWSGIDVQLKRRHDLIPNIVETCLLYTSPSPRDRTRYRMPSSD